MRLSAQPFKWKWVIFAQERIKLREWIPHIGPILIVIPLKIYLDLLWDLLFPRGLSDIQSYVRNFTTVDRWARAHAMHRDVRESIVILAEDVGLKGRDHGYTHACRVSLQNKFVGSTLNSKSPLPVQSLKILRFIPTSVALAGLVILR